MIYLILILITFVWLFFDKSIDVSILDSNIFGEKFSKENKFYLIILLSLIAPITIYKIISLKTENMTSNFKFSIKPIITIAVIAILAYFAINIGKTAVSYYNTSVDLQVGMNKKQEERLVIIDRITKIVQQKLQIAKINDTSYYRNLLQVAFARQDGMNLAWKWANENNANANYYEVSSMYKKVMASIESERNLLFTVEKDMQEINFQYNTLRNKFPSSLYLFYRPRSLNYKPISTGNNKIVNETGIDNQVKLE